MMSHVVGSLVGVSCCLVCAVYQPPTTVVEIHVDRVKPPVTVASAVQSAQAAAVVTMLSSRQMASDPGDVIRTIYSFRVDDVVKNHNMLTPFSELFRVGGDVTVGTQTTSYIEPTFPRYKIGSSYIIFLSFNQYGQMFQPMYGPDGSFEIDSSGSVVPFGDSLLAQSQRGQSASRFIAQLKSMVQ